MLLKVLSRLLLGLFIQMCRVGFSLCTFSSMVPGYESISGVGTAFRKPKKDESVKGAA